MTNPKIDFQRLVPDPVPPPDTPPCEAMYDKWLGGVKTHAQCGAKSHYRIDGKHYCRRHGPAAALNYLYRIGLDQ